MGRRRRNGWTRLTSSSAFTRRNPERWRFQVCSSTDPRHGGNPCGGHGLWRVGLLGVPSPWYSYPRPWSTLVVGCARRGSSGLRQTRSYVPWCFQQSTPRHPCEGWAVIDWFRLLSDCLGRAGRHRRTGGNHSIPCRIPPLSEGYFPLQRMEKKSRTGHRSVDFVRVAEFIPRLKARIFSSHLYNVVATAGSVSRPWRTALRIPSFPDGYLTHRSSSVLAYPDTGRNDPRLERGDESAFRCGTAKANPESAA